MDDRSFLLWAAERLVRYFGQDAHSHVVSRLSAIAAATPVGVKAPSVLVSETDPDNELVAPTSDRKFLFRVSQMMESPNMDYNHHIRSIALTRSFDTATD